MSASQKGGFITPCIITGNLALNPVENEWNSKSYDHDCTRQAAGPSNSTQRSYLFSPFHNNRQENLLYRW